MVTLSNSSYIALTSLIPIYIIIFYILRRRRKYISAIINLKFKKGKNNMVEIIRSLIGKTCLIHSLDESLSYSYYTIKDVVDNCVVLEAQNGTKVFANIEFITSIKEKKTKNK